MDDRVKNIQDVQTIQEVQTAVVEITKIPPFIVRGVIVICCLPFLFNLLGIDFGSNAKALPVGDSGSLVIDDLFYRLSGAFTHTILEWTAFCAAIFTVFLAFAHYRVVRDITTPVIAIALFCAGCMDAFHTLAAARLIEAVADNTNLIPFTWAISRVFNALIMIIGVSLFLLRPHSELKTGMPFVLGISLIFGIIAYTIIHFCATSAQLPQTMYPDSLITRPWDVGPLVLFIFAGVYVFPKFYKQHRSIFAHSLIICAIPEIAVELHMAFGSTALFDNHFNIAHFLKIFAYLIPLIGLTLDYVQTYLAREKLQEKLVESEKELKTFVNDAPVMMWMTNAQGHVVLFNHTWLKFTRHSLEEEISYDWDGDDIHPDDKEFCMHNYDKAINGQESIQQEYRMKNSDGNYYWFFEDAVPRFNSRHQYEGHIGTCVDITDQKNAEENLIKRTKELEKTNQELEQFAYVASHDLQEPLRMVSSYTQLLSRRYKGKLDEDADEFIDYVVDGAKRMQTLIQDLLRFSRLSTEEQAFRSVEANKLVDYAIENLMVAIDESGTVVTKEDLPAIYGNEGQFRQLFQNLIGNAIKYRDPEKMNKIHVSVKQLDNDWQFCIEDNGIGIEANYFEKIFVIFQRLHGKSVYEGTGIGLSICKKIIENHHGRIWVESEYGQGTRFYFTTLMK